MRLRSTCISITLFTCLALPAMGQTPPAPAAPPAWSVGEITFSGLVDAYYTYNANHPASGFNGLYNFNHKANQFSLNMAKLSLEHTADPVGFRVDLGFGRAFDTVHQFEPSGTASIMRNIEQAYISYKPGKSGLQLDLGKFVTSAGAEVIETHSNWNYSRSLLFAYAIPYYHFGLRATETKGHFTGGFQLVNGWNNVEDTNSGKTIGLTGAITGSKASWYNVYYTGPEKAGTNKGWRNLFDTNLVLTPNSKFNAYLNFDYGRDKDAIGNGKQEWYGFAAATKFQLNDANALVARGEFFNDKDGFNTLVAQEVKEVTFTYEYKWTKGLLTRIEYRRDWSDHKFFERGPVGLSDAQSTVSLGVVAFFGPK
ncbi:MAG: porin [Acidobacteriota bacterium]